MAQRKETRIRYRYDDFVLKLRHTEMEYTVEAQAPSGDRRKRPVALRQWSEDLITFPRYFQQQAAQAEAEQAKTDQTQGQIVATDKVRAFGRQLFTALFQGGILTLYRQSLEDIVKARDDAPAGYTRGLRIVLDLEHAPDLTRIPWEFLYDAEKKEGEKFLCLDPQTPVVRRLRFGARRHYEVNPPLLFALFSANPRGTIPLSEQNREIRAIRDILDRHPSVELKDKSAAPASDILKIMQNWPHIVHFTGHGSGHSLAFEDVELPANQLKRLTNVNRALRLVVINACEAGKEVTETLARSGIPAIIAMQFMISDPAGLAFAQTFYENLITGHSLETSLCFARLEMGIAIPNVESFEWAAPVLYLQSLSSEEVLVEALTIPSDVDQRLSQIEDEIFLAAQYQKAQRFLATENWERAISHLQTILNLDDDYRDAPTMLARAQARQGAEAAYQRGVEAALRNDWSAAIRSFEEALEFQPDHEEARRRLKTAQHNQDLGDNYREGIAAYRRGGGQLRCNRPGKGYPLFGTSGPA